MKYLLIPETAILALVMALSFFGCGDDSSTNPSPPHEAFGVDKLLTNLEYPSGLWVRGDRVYFTETNGHNTSFGGAVRLRVYKLASETVSLLKDHPNCHDALVVTEDGKIYLGSYVGSTPGESGRVSVLDPTTLVESNVTELEIAVEDMFLESDNDILVIGSSDLPGAKSLYRLAPPAYTSPNVVKTGLGRTQGVTALGSDIYFADNTAIRKISGDVTEAWFTKFVSSLSASSKYLFYSDPYAGKIGMIDLASKHDSVLVSGLHYPDRVRWVAETNRLYFTELGTTEGEFKDGTLQVIKGIR